MAQNYPLHNDLPEIGCQLQRADLKKHILELIQNVLPPRTFAIHGTWGMGKTSLMAQLYVDLGGSYKFRLDRPKDENKSNRSNDGDNLKIQVVWFDAWQYQHEENILVPLLHEIRAQLTWKYKFSNFFGEAVVPGLLAALQSIDLTLGKVVSVKGFGEKFTKNSQEYLKERFANDLSSELLRKMLQEAINQLLGLDKIVYNERNTDGRKLVVFIDDLDRCEPDTAYKILEAIKVYLNLDNCLFVLGMDMQEVERMLARKYEKSFKPEEIKSQVELRNHARLYLEKICQDVFHLPMLDAIRRETYFRYLLKPLEDEKKAEQVSIFLQTMQLLAEYRFLPPFPRSIKMLANNILSHHNRVRIFEGQTNRVSEFIILIYLYTFHYDIYHLIYLHQDKDFYNQAFLPYCDNPIQFNTDTGGHALLNNIFLPKEMSLGASTTAESQPLNSMFPHESLRQWLWIRKLVIEKRTITADCLNALKF